ncbi:MAG: hypothetical protein PPP55_12755 [Halorubrum sp.]
MVVPEDETDAGGGRQPSVRSVERDEPLADSESDIPLAFPERDPSVIDDTTELYLMERHAADDGSVTVQILGWERDGNTVVVSYSLPTGEQCNDRYRWPTGGRYDESDFVGLVRRLGYAPGAAAHIAGEFARARHENGRWRIVTGRETRGAINDDRRGEAGSETPSEPADNALAERSRTGSAARTAISRRLSDTDPMDLGITSVGLVFLAVVLPAALAIPTGGLTGPAAALGVVLFGGGVATLWLSVVVATA